MEQRNIINFPHFMKPEGSLPRTQVPVTYPYPELHRSGPCPLLRSYQSITPGPWYFFIFRNKVSFYDEDLLAPRPTPKLEDHPLSAVRYCLFSVFAATLHIAGHSSHRNPRTRHAVVTETVSFICFNERGRQAQLIPQTILLLQLLYLFLKL
jgi:hypothetical protein